MDCRRAEELLSDHLEGGLEGVLAADLDAHLERCAECRSLREALVEVMQILRSAPEFEPAAGLAERAATAALRAGRPATPAQSTWRVPAQIQALAASLALAVGAGFFLVGAAPRTASLRLTETPLSARLAEARDAFIERRDRAIEDFHLIQVVIATAFEGRIDRVNERVDDYRRLLERRRGEGREPKKSEVGARPPRVAAHLPNSERPGSVRARGRRMGSAPLDETPGKGAC